MRNFADAALLIAVVAIVGAGPTLSATPPQPPVAVEYETPPPMKTGDEATTVITFRALADLDRLEVSAAALSGLAIVSDPKQASFQSVKKGDRRQLTVTIRLTGAEKGVLAAYFTIQRGAKRDSGAAGITFRTSDH
jgi:hypothetical protein